ncbi:MAG: 2-isopropylmalate synthase [Verrucomicrobiales bacterium]|jgi:2-isopropylmalate synthase|nr:2-isopropylmalate synthase [Verrucomicrobiales bacterium]
MTGEPNKRYQAFPPVRLPDRRWPNHTLAAAPSWCSVDLRDGNQALPEPMNVTQKLEFFKELVRIGFKEIEVGFPAASNTEYEFVRRLIEEHRIPDDVTIQVLVQAREELIERTVQALVGARQAIIHLYNSTSPAQRRVVFGLTQPEIIAIARRGTQWIKDRLPRLAGSRVMFQYSPESFSATEVEFAVDICQAVMEVWQPTPRRKMILNLPDTVEVAMPNVYADQIEWFIRHLNNRESAIISVHTHNDRGTGVAATELALLAGAERVEGTLFGNGERTGNLDIVTVALNMYAHGIPPGLDFSDIQQTRKMYERYTGMEVPPRQPYGGDLVFTAFSGSHQDAIKKGFAERQKNPDAIWDVPYLTIDPADLGREYGEVIRVNSQSGKGGITYLLESEYGIYLPRALQIEFGRYANDEIDRLGREVTAAELREIFWRQYVNRATPYALEHFHADGAKGRLRCRATVSVSGGKRLDVTGEGNGPIAAFVQGLIASGSIPCEVISYAEHSLGAGSEASAIAYIQIRGADGDTAFGAGTDTSIELASIKAVVSALNRLGKA